MMHTLFETVDTNDGLVLTGATVLSVLGAIAWIMKRLYTDKQKSDAAHIACEERRASEAIQRAKELEQALRDELEGRDE